MSHILNAAMQERFLFRVHGLIDGHPLLESEEPSGAVLFVPIPVGLGYRLHNAEHLGNPTMAV